MKLWIKSDVDIQSENCGLIKFSLKKNNFRKLSSDKNIEGKITEIIPNKLLSYTWPIKNDSEISEVTWSLNSLNSQKTLVKFSHSGFGKDDGNEKKILSSIWEKLHEDFKNSL